MLDLSNHLVWLNPTPHNWLSSHSFFSATFTSQNQIYNWCTEPSSRPTYFLFQQSIIQSNKISHYFNFIVTLRCDDIYLCTVKFHERNPINGRLCNQKFCEGKISPMQILYSVQVHWQIRRVDQQKAARFRSDLCVRGALHIVTLTV